LPIVLTGCARDAQVIGDKGFQGFVLPGTQITLFEIDSNEDGEVDDLSLADWYGAKLIYTLIDTDFDGVYDLQLHTVTDRVGERRSVYWDIGYDGVLDVAMLIDPSKDTFTFGLGTRWLVYFDDRWVEVQRMSLPSPAQKEIIGWSMLSFDRRVEHCEFELGDPNTGLRVRYNPDKGKMERALTP